MYLGEPPRFPPPRRATIGSRWRSVLLLAALWVAPLAAQGSPPEPGVAIAGAKAGELALETATSDFAAEITLYATSSGVKEIKVSVTPLVGPSGKQISPTVTLDGAAGNRTFDLDAVGEAKLRIQADLTEVGAYQSGVTLIHGGKRTETKLTVKRTRPELPVEILGLERVRGTGSSPEIWLTARPTGPSTLKLGGPDLLELSLEETEKSKLQASFDRIELKDEAGNSLEPPFDLTPEKPRRIRLVFSGLESAGTYKGKIQLSAKDYLPRAAELTLQIRDCWGWALFFIALGVAVSWGLRSYAQSGRPRLVRRRRLVALQGDLRAIVESHEGGPSARENEVLGSLQRRLEGLDEDLALGMESQTDDKLAAIDGQITLLPRWLTLGRRIEKLEPPTLRPTFQRKLESVTAYLQKELPTAKEQEDADKALVELEREIPAAVRQDLESRVAALQEALKNPVLATEAAKLRLTAEVLPALARAADYSAKEDPAKARREYLAARGAYARILAEDLAATVASATPPPGQDDGAWATLKAQVRQGLAAAGAERDPDQAVALYEAAAALYLASLARAWAVDVLETKTAILGYGVLTDQQKVDFITKLDSSGNKLQDAAAKADQRQLAEAATAYQEAQKERQEVVAALQQVKGVSLGAAQTAGAAPVPSGVPAAAGEGTIFPIPPRPAWDRPTARDLSWRLFWRDLWFSLALLAIAVLLGLKVLWVPDPTWGGVDDYFVAALWGLGLHQVAAGAAFEGIAALIGRFQK